MYKPRTFDPALLDTVLVWMDREGLTVSEVAQRMKASTAWLYMRFGDRRSRVQKNFLSRLCRAVGIRYSALVNDGVVVPDGRGRRRRNSRKEE